MKRSTSDFAIAQRLVYLNGFDAAFDITLQSLEARCELAREEAVESIAESRYARAEEVFIALGVLKSEALYAD